MTRAAWIHIDQWLRPEMLTLLLVWLATKISPAAELMASDADPLAFGSDGIEVAWRRFRRPAR